MQSDDSVIQRIFAKQYRDNTVPVYGKINTAQSNNRVGGSFETSSRERWNALKKELGEAKGNQANKVAAHSDKPPPKKSFGQQDTADLKFRKIGATMKDTKIKQVSKAPERNIVDVNQRSETLDVDKRVVKKCTNYERRMYIDKHCKALQQNVKVQGLSILDPIFVLQPKLEITLCTVSKNARTAWTRILSASTEYGKKYGPLQQTMSTDILRQWGLNAVNYDKAKDLNYTNVIVLRHPFERVASEYEDRIAFKNDAVMKKHVQELFRTGVSKDSAKYNAPVSFVEYLKLVIAGSEYPKNLLVQPYSSTCHVCTMPYGKVIRTETMQADAQQFMSMFNVKAGMVDDYLHTHSSVQTNKVTKEQRNTYQKHLKLFDTVPAFMIDKLKELFINDFTLFGYEFDKNNKIASCRMQTLTGDTCC